MQAAKIIIIVVIVVAVLNLIYVLFPDAFERFLAYLRHGPRP